MKKKWLVCSMLTVICCLCSSITVSEAEDIPPTVFLTFDDGPSKTTPFILETLKREGVHATFFPIGRLAVANPEIIKQALAEGHTIGLHSWKHDYEIYENIHAFIADFEKNRYKMKELSAGISTEFYRFPGGSGNQKTSESNRMMAKHYLLKEGVSYVDWNVTSADSSRTNTSVPKARIVKNIITQMENQPIAVILMHDAAARTATSEALPAVIHELKKRGYHFKGLKEANAKERNLLIEKRAINRDAPNIMYGE
jgi:peptidoglycan/xylan/chitin deacetylase (PgdA/CDA1 family)